MNSPLLSTATKRKISFYPFIFLVICCFALKLQLKAQEKKFGIKTSPVSPIYGPINHSAGVFCGEILVKPEFKVSNRFSIFLGGSYLFKNPFNDWKPHLVYETFNSQGGFRVQGGFNVFILEDILDTKSLAGFYLGPMVSYSSYMANGIFKDVYYYAHGTRKHVEKKPYQIQITKTNIGFFSFGYRYINSIGLSLEAFIRLKYQYYSVESSDGNLDYQDLEYSLETTDGTGIRPRIGLEVGYFFGQKE